MCLFEEEVEGVCMCFCATEQQEQPGLLKGADRVGDGMGQRSHSSLHQRRWERMGADRRGWHEARRFGDTDPPP